MKFKRIVSGIALFVVAYSYGQTGNKANQGIFINRATIEFTLVNGQTSVEKIIITNNLNKKLQLNVYLNDFLRDTTGAHTYLKPGSITHSCANWISLDKTFLEMAPGQSMEINVKMRVPDSSSAIKEMKWAMLFIETVHEKAKPTGTNLTTTVNTDMRYGIHIYQLPPLLNNKDVKMLSFGLLPNTKNIYRIVCQNTGQTQLSCKSYLEFSNLTDGKKFKIEARKFPLFPEQKRYIDFMIPDSLPKGKYIVTGVVDGGSDVPLEASQIRLEVK